jgi:ketosteroid isomerase-like protein
MPAAPSIDIASIPTVPSAPPEGLTSAVESAAPTTATSNAADEFAVRRALHSYEAAYEGLDVAATAEIWPTVDRRALSRAFAALKSQDLVFKTCSVTVHDASATAYCRGTLEYVRKVGNPAPLSAEQQWVFKMRREDGAWKIDDVSASQPASTNGALQ